MSATALYWAQLQHVIRLRIAELARIFREGITANAAVADPASGSEPPELSTVFRLTQEEAAENWLSAMGAACIVQLLAEAQSVWEHPNWRFLYAVSKEEIAPRLEELLHASFGITQKDRGLIKRWGDDIGGGTGFDLERSTTSIARAFYIARAKKRAVNQILDQLLGVSRELAFGVPTKPKFGVPAVQINTTTSPEARPGQPVPSPMHKASAEAEPTRAPNAKRRGRKKRPRSEKRPKIRSTLRQHVLHYLIEHPTASAKDVCVWCDQQEIKGPKSWYKGARDHRELLVIYRKDSAIKGRIDKYVSDIRHSIKERY